MRPSAEQIRQLSRTHSLTFPREFEDPNGHVNVRHYLGTHAEALDVFLNELGMHTSNPGQHSFFAIEHHIRYWSECAVGDDVSVYVRLLGVGEKVLHGIALLLNDTRDELSNSLEFTLAHVDLETRRAASWGSELSGMLEDRLARDTSIDWTAPVIEGPMGASAGR